MTTSFIKPKMQFANKMIENDSLVNHTQFDPHSMLHKAFNFPQKQNSNNNMNKSFLDYTFMSHKTKLTNQEDKYKTITKAKEYLFDLTNTWKLNMQMLKIYINKDDINQLLVSIETKWKEKGIKNTLIKEKKSKVLIEKQIQEEFARKIRESNHFYKDQIESAKDNVYNKEEYIKIFMKKLKEVEIFVQKHTKGVNIVQYSKYKVWKIADFIRENTNMIHKQKEIYDELERIRKLILEVKQENYFYREETIVITDKEDTQGLKEKKKINKFIENYRKNCHVLQTRIKLFNTFLDNFSKTIQYLNVPNDLDVKEIVSYRDNNNDQQNTKRKKEGINASTVIDKSCDISKKPESLMDFSIILNKRFGNDESKVNDSLIKPANFGNITYAWDLSRIHKKD